MHFKMGRHKILKKQMVKNSVGLFLNVKMSKGTQVDLTVLGVEPIVPSGLGDAKKFARIG